MSAEDQAFWTGLAKRSRLVAAAIGEIADDGEAQDHHGPWWRAHERASLAGAVGIQRMGGEDAHADQGEDSCWEIHHCPASHSPIVARNLLRDCFQIRSKMNCMAVVPVLLTTRNAALCFRMFSSAPENGFVRASVRTEWWQFRDGRACFLWHQRSDSIMLEAIVLLLGVSTFALILIAFWGLDLRGLRRRRG
jgi:hypothetical protein